MSTISASTTSTTAYKVTADTTGTLVLQTGSTPTTAVTIDANQNVGVGVTPAAKFNIGSGGAARFNRSDNATYGEVSYAGAGVGMKYYDANSDGHRFFNGATQAMTLDASSNLLVGQTSVSGTTVGFSVGQSGLVRTALASSTNGTTNWDTYSTVAGAYRFYVGMAGTVFATSTTISAISDIRYKENIRDLNAGLAEVMALKPRLYDWKEGKGADIKNARGFIAQEFEEVFPDLIDEWRDPAPEGEEPYKSVRQDLIPVLVKAIQELKTINDQLTARIEALEAK